MKIAQRNEIYEKHKVKELLLFSKELEVSDPFFDNDETMAARVVYEHAHRAAYVEFNDMVVAKIMEVSGWDYERSDEFWQKHVTLEVMKNRSYDVAAHEAIHQ